MNKHAGEKVGSSTADINGVLFVMQKRKKFIAAVFFLFILGAIIISLAEIPGYKSSGILYLGKSSSYLADIESAKTVITSNNFLDHVAEQMKLGLDVIKSVRTENVKGTKFLRIYAYGKTPQESQQIAEKVISMYYDVINQEYQKQKEEINKKQQAAIKQINEIDGIISVSSRSLPYTDDGNVADLTDFRQMRTLDYLRFFQSERTALREQYTASQKELDSLVGPQIIQTADLPKRPERPNIFLNIVLASFLGLIAGIMGSLLFDFYEFRVRDAKRK